MRLIKVEDREEAKHYTKYTLKSFEDIQGEGCLTIHQPSLDYTFWQSKIDAHLSLMTDPHLLLTLTGMDIVSGCHPNIIGAYYDLATVGRFDAIDLALNTIVRRQKEFVTLLDSGNWKIKPIRDKERGAEVTCVYKLGDKPMYIEEVEESGRKSPSPLKGYTFHRLWFSTYFSNLI